MTTAGYRAYRALHEQIVSWQLAPGTPLSEAELAERLGVSRTPLRSALARLALEGLVDTSRGRTGVVSEVSLDRVDDLFEVREALEVQAARLAARRRRDPAVFDDLAARFAEAPATLADDAHDTHDYYAVVAEFDAAVDHALGNAELRAALDRIRVHLARVRRTATDNPERLLRAAEEHRRICEAIRDGDEALAAAAATVHLRAALASVRATLEARLDGAPAASPSTRPTTRATASAQKGTR